MPPPPLPSSERAKTSSTWAVWSRRLDIAMIVTAKTGIATGIAVLGMFFFFVFLPFYNDIRIKPKAIREISQMRQVMLACRHYEADYDGRYPESLADLAENELIEASQLESILAPGSVFLYRPGFSSASDPEEIFVASPVAHQRWLGGLRRVVARVGARLEDIPEDQFQSDYAHLFPRG